MSQIVSSKYRGEETYTKSDHHSYVKENFKELGNLIEEKIKCGSIPESGDALDVGCATGALIKYLMNRFPKIQFKGLDISKELIQIAKQKVPETCFEVASIMDLPNGYGNSFDIVLCIGVLGIFDEPEAKQALNKLIECARPGGAIYVFHQFNEIDIDVIVKHRLVGWDGWGKGWNIYSYRTVGNWVKGRVKSYRFIDFSMPFDLHPQENPIRTWTIDMADGTRRLTNGLKLLVDLRFLEILV